MQIMKPINWIREMIHKAYAWTAHWATTDHAIRALALLSAAEAVIFPIPPDPLLMAITLNDKEKKWWRYATITLVASLVGGVVGYYFGAALFESIGQKIIDVFHLQAEYDSLGEKFQNSSVITVFTAAITPIPYKLITITAGAFKVSFVDFIIGSLLGRGLRFFAVAGITSHLGKKYKTQIERYIDLISIGIVVLVVIILLLSR